VTTDRLRASLERLLQARTALAEPLPADAIAELASLCKEVVARVQELLKELARLQRPDERWKAVRPAHALGGEPTLLQTARRCTRRRCGPAPPH
jgi:hypothetical protein